MKESVRLYLELVIGAVHLLVVIDFERIQELEVQGEAPFYPDAVVAAQIGWVGLRIFEARDIAGGLCVQPTAALSCESGTRQVSRELRLALQASAQSLPLPRAHSASP